MTEQEAFSILDMLSNDETYGLGESLLEDTERRKCFLGCMKQYVPALHDALSKEDRLLSRGKRHYLEIENCCFDEDMAKWISRCKWLRRLSIKDSEVDLDVISMIDANLMAISIVGSFVFGNLSGLSVNTISVSECEMGKHLIDGSRFTLDYIFKQCNGHPINVMPQKWFRDVIFHDNGQLVPTCLIGSMVTNLSISINNSTVPPAWIDCFKVSHLSIYSIGDKFPDWVLKIKNVGNISLEGTDLVDIPDTVAKQMADRHIRINIEGTPLAQNTDRIKELRKKRLEIQAHSYEY